MGPPYFAMLAYRYDVLFLSRSMLIIDFQGGMLFPPSQCPRSARSLVNNCVRLAERTRNSRPCLTHERSSPYCRPIALHQFHRCVRYEFLSQDHFEYIGPTVSSISAGGAAMVVRTSVLPDDDE